MSASVIKVIVCKLAFILLTALVIIFTPSTTSADSPLTVEQLIERFGLKK